MKALALIVLGVLILTGSAFAWDRHNGQYAQDDYGSWTRKDNLYKDSDRDGVMNIHDRSDRNPNKW